MLWLLAQAQPEVELSMASSKFWLLPLQSFIFGIVGIVLLLLGYWLFDHLTPRIDVQKELNEKNTAVALVVAAILLGIAYIAAHVVQ